MLHVLVKEKCDKGKAICVRGDDDLNSNGGDALGFHDDYFGCRINEEIPFVTRFVPTELLSSYEHPLQLCATSTPINEGHAALNPTPIIGSNPTPAETVLEEVANEDDGRDKAGDDVLEGGDEVRTGCDGVPEEDDGVPGGGNGLHERVYDSRCQHSEPEETRFVPLISSDNGRNDGSDLMVGKHFDSKEDLNTKLNLVAINGKFEIKVKKSTRTLKEVVCVDEPNCLWRVRATKMPGSNFFVIRQYNGIHTCSLMNRSINHRQASSRVIGARMKGHFIDCKQPPNPKVLMGFMSQELQVQVSYWKAWKGRQFAQNLIRGTPQHSFAMLPSYCYMLKQVNKGTLTHIEVDSDNKFKYFFMALGAAIRGFKNMRKVIGIDGAWIKTKYKGVLMVAATQDSENHSYPIAWGLGDTENNDSWTWFFEKLKEVIPDSSEICFISDRNQSISYAVSHVYPMAQHGACYYHVMMNIKNRFKSAASLGVFKAAAESYCLEEFDKHFSDMSQKYPKVAQYLEKDVKFEKWSRAHFKGNRYEVMTTNIVETLNNMMLKAREYPITAMIDFIIFTMGQWFFTRRRESVLVTTPITPKREAILRRRFDAAGSLTPYQLNENEYTVMGGDFNACVNLTTRSCTCRVFDIDKIPCIHAIAAAGLYRPQHTGSYMYSLCSEYYTSDYWMLAYAETIYPVPPESQWHNIPEEVRAIKVIEPDVKMFRGRPRLTRFPSQGECIVKKYKCATCGQGGHNSKKCPNLAHPSDVRSNT
jgi:hypothetical protein